MSDKSQPEPNTKLYLHGKPVQDFVEVHEHISPVSAYVKVLLALFVLTGLTYAVSFANLGAASLPVAILVAVIKATLVCMFFMHLKYDDRYHVFVFASTLLFVAIFFTFTIFDLSSRERLNETQDTFYRRQFGGWNDQQYIKAPIPQPEGEDEGEGEGEGEGQAPGGQAPGGQAPGGH